MHSERVDQLIVRLEGQIKFVLTSELDSLAHHKDLAALCFIRIQTVGVSCCNQWLVIFLRKLPEIMVILFLIVTIVILNLIIVIGLA